MDGLISNIPEWWLLVLAVLALCRTWRLAASEAALHRLGRPGLTELQVADSPRAAAVEQLAENRQQPLAGLALSRVLAEMTTAVSLTLVVADLLPAWWQVLLVAVLVAALLVAVVAGSVPRHLGRRHPGRVLHILLPVISVVLVLTRPVTALARRLTPQPKLTEAEAREEAAEDLRDMVDRVSQSEQLEDDERTMLQSVFELGSTLVREVMVPRPDMVTIDAGKPLTKAMAMFVRSGYSRVPVVGESVDDVRGVLFFKDVIRRTHMRPEAGSDLVEAVAREAVRSEERRVGSEGGGRWGT